jgi:hypothetical protein
MSDRYVPTHQSQYGPTCTPITRSSGCTWTSASTGVDAATGGKRKPSPDEIHALVKNREETSPSTPGWSLDDLDLAMARMGIPFEIRSGEGWTGVIEALNEGLYVVLQGDSDVFGDETCSGRFDGPHAIGVHPDALFKDGRPARRVNDPICPKARIVTEAKLQQYAEKFSRRVLFGVFENPVPDLPPPPPPPPTLRYGARALVGGPIRKRVREPAVSVRAKPEPDARVLRVKDRGDYFTAWQVVQTPKGRWFGNYRGRRWVRAGAFNR